MTYLDRRQNIKIIFSDGKEYTPYNVDFTASFKHSVSSNNGLGLPKIFSATQTGSELRSIPLTISFVGDDHDIVADQFFDSASKTGDVRLQPPYGKEILCIISSITQRYSVVDDIASTFFDVQFVEISGIKTPIGGETQQNSILDQVDSVNISATAIMDQISPQNAADEATITAFFSNSVDSVNNYLRSIISSEVDLISDFDATYSSIKQNINDVVNNTSLIAEQTATLISLPIKSATAKAGPLLSLYSGLIASQFEIDFPFSNVGKSLASTAQFFGGSALASLCAGLVTREYDNAPEVIIVADSYASIYDSYRETIDNIQDDFANSDVDLTDNFMQTGELDVPLNYLSQQTLGYLVNEAFDAKKEVVLLLDYETTALNIAIKYYPDQFLLDEKSALDYVIETNKLTGDELFLIPRRREIKIYV